MGEKAKEMQKKREHWKGEVMSLDTACGPGQQATHLGESPVKEA